MSKNIILIVKQDILNRFEFLIVSELMLQAQNKNISARMVDDRFSKIHPVECLRTQKSVLDFRTFQLFSFEIRTKVAKVEKRISKNSSKKHNSSKVQLKQSFYLYFSFQQ